MERRATGSEKDRKDRERRQRAKKVDRLLERIIRAGTTINDPQIGSGRRVISEPLRVTSWTRRDNGYETRYKEVMVDGVTVFFSTVLIFNQTANPADVQIFRPGPWQERLKGVARGTRQPTPT